MNQLLNNNNFNIISKNKIKKYAEKNNITINNIDDNYNNEINEIFKKPAPIKQRKIIAPNHSFNIDIIVMPWYKKLKYILCLIDINSRKSFIYILKNKWLNEIIEKFNIFLNDLKQNKGLINSITGDNEFNKKNFIDLMDSNKIQKYFIIATDEHIIKKSNK